ncbi:MAG: hypothetical protein GEV11_09700 [Streptosporangiales bacterium]|nr:hypothetical protein [Streptosporangiales bacterium]
MSGPRNEQNENTPDEATANESPPNESPADEPAVNEAATSEGAANEGTVHEGTVHEGAGSQAAAGSGRAKWRFRRPGGKVAMAVAGAALFVVGLGGGVVIGHASAGDGPGRDGPGVAEERRAGTSGERGPGGDGRFGGDPGDRAFGKGVGHPGAPGGSDPARQDDSSRPGAPAAAGG